MARTFVIAERDLVCVLVVWISVWPESVSARVIDTDETSAPYRSVLVNIYDRPTAVVLKRVANLMREVANKCGDSVATRGDRPIVQARTDLKVGVLTYGTIRFLRSPCSMNVNYIRRSIAYIYDVERSGNSDPVSKPGRQVKIPNYNLRTVSGDKSFSSQLCLEFGRCGSIISGHNSSLTVSYSFTGGLPEQSGKYPKPQGREEEGSGEASYPPVRTRVPLAVILGCGSNGILAWGLVRADAGRRVSGIALCCAAALMMVSGIGLMLALGVPATWGWWL